MRTAEHLINESEFGSIGILDDRCTFLVTFKKYQWQFTDVGISRFKHYLFAQSSEFHWFKTLLEEKAFIRIDSLGLQLVLSQAELEQLRNLLMETELIIEGRLLVLPSNKNLKK